MCKAEPTAEAPNDNWREVYQHHSTRGSRSRSGLEEVPNDELM